MAEWLYEEGIGEARAALIEKGRLVEAQIERESDAARAGAVMQGKLIRTLIPKKRGIARLISGEVVLVEPIPPKIAEGATVLLEILREAIPEEGRAKLAKTRIAQPGSKAHPAPSLLQRLRACGLPIIPCPAHEEDRFEAHCWSELMEEAISGEIGTEEAALRIFPTPAMILIDVDGSMPPAKLGPKGAKLAAQAIRRMGLTGSIGIDLPTMNNKDERAVASAHENLGADRQISAAAVRTHGGQRLRLRPDHPSAGAHEPHGTAPRRPGRNGGARAAAPRRTPRQWRSRDDHGSACDHRPPA